VAKYDTGGDETPVPGNKSADVAEDLGEGGDAIPVLGDTEDDVTRVRVVADGGDVRIQVPVDEGGGAVQVPERGDAVHVKVHEEAGVIKNNTLVVMRSVPS
jgi:hypothetical protein